MPSMNGGGSNPFGSAIDTSEMNVSALAQSLLGRSTSSDMRGDLECAASSHTHAVANLSDASANGKSLISAADYAAMRALLDLEIGTDLQAYDVQLAALAALSYSGNGSKVVRVNASADGFELASISGGKLLQSVATSDGAVATGTTTVPFDDTIMQNTEGTQFLSLAITPTASDSILEIDVLANLSMNSGGGGYTIGCGLFVDSTADALQCVARYYPAGGDVAPVFLRHRVSAGSTSARTYKFRAGPSAAATITLNGTASARKFGGVMLSWMTIREIAA